MEKKKNLPGTRDAYASRAPFHRLCSPGPSELLPVAVGVGGVLEWTGRWW